MLVIRKEFTDEAKTRGYFAEPPFEVPDDTVLEDAFHEDLHIVRCPEGAAEGYRFDGDAISPPSPQERPSQIIDFVMRTQGKMQLLRMGLYDQAKVLIEDSAAETRLWFDDAPRWSRDSPYLIALTTELGLTGEAFEDFLRGAARIET